MERECKYCKHRGNPTSMGICCNCIDNDERPNWKLDEDSVSPNKIRKANGLSEVNDMVNHPPHYQSKNGLEMIDIIEALVEDLQGIEATDTGNILKYIGRWKKKNGVQDLRKAKWYLEHLIKHIEEKEIV